MALITKTCFSGNFSQCQFPIHQQLFRSIDSAEQNVLMWAQAGGVFEHACEMRRAQLDLSCQSGDRYILAEILVDEMDGFFQDGWSQALGWIGGAQSIMRIPTDDMGRQRCHQGFDISKIVFFGGGVFMQDLNHEFTDKGVLGSKRPARLHFTRIPLLKCDIGQKLLVQTDHQNSPGGLEPHRMRVVGDQDTDLARTDVFLDTVDSLAPIQMCLAVQAEADRVVEKRDVLKVDFVGVMFLNHEPRRSFVLGKIDNIIGTYRAPSPGIQFQYHWNHLVDILVHVQILENPSLFPRDDMQRMATSLGNHRAVNIFILRA